MTLRRSFWISPPGLFRIILALSVSSAHISHFHIGKLAVFLFFLLSGYWVSKIFVEKFRTGNWAKFLMNRLLRIYPLYALVLFSCICLFYIFPIRTPTVGLQTLSIIGITETRFDPIGVSWSLDIELQFYICVPIIIFIYNRLPLTAFLAVCGSLFATCSALTLLMRAHIFMMYGPAFIAGSLIYLLNWKSNDLLALVSLSVFAVFSAACMLIPFTARFIIGDAGVDESELFSMIWMAPLLPYVARSLSIPSSPFDRLVGDLSYPLYLVHVPIFIVMEHFHANKPAMVAVAIGVALAVLFLFDRPIDSLRRRLSEMVSTAGPLMDGQAEKT